MQATRKNMERREEHVAGADDQALQYMLTEAQMDSQAVMDQVAQEVNQLPGSDGSYLLLDESGLEPASVSGICSAATPDCLASAIISAMTSTLQLTIILEQFIIHQPPAFSAFLPESDSACPGR